MRRVAKHNPREQIPEESRVLVTRREHGLCIRCGMGGSDWHHRRRRNVRDGHQHCPCNGVLVCRVCHGWAHSHVSAAHRVGLVVSMALAPRMVPVMVDGLWRFHACSGLSQGLRADQVMVGPEGRTLLTEAAAAFYGLA